MWSFNSPVAEAEFRTLLGKPIEAQAEYASTMCHRNAANVTFLEDMLGIPHSYTSSSMNTCKLGNLAYLALHAPEFYRARFRAKYEGYIAHAAAQPIIVTSRPYAATASSSGVVNVPLDVNAMSTDEIFERLAQIMIEQQQLYAALKARVRARAFGWVVHE